MGNLVNPIGQAIIVNNRLFWTNNFSFFYNKQNYKKYTFQIRCLNRCFTLIFKYVRRLLGFKGNFTWSFNFTGQNNNSLHVIINTRDLQLMHHGMRNVQVIKNYFRRYKPIKTLSRKVTFKELRITPYVTIFKSKCIFILKRLKARYLKLYRRWKGRLIKDLLRKVYYVKKKKSKTTRVTKHSMGWHRGKNKAVYYMKYLSLIKEPVSKKEISLRKISSIYMIRKFKLIYEKFKYFKRKKKIWMSYYLTYYFSLFFKKFMKLTGLKYVKFCFRSKMDRFKRKAYNIVHYCHNLLYNGFKINYVLKQLRWRYLRSHSIVGLKLILSGRFFRRGRARYVVVKWGVNYKLNKLEKISFVRRAKLAQYGLCSITLLLFGPRKRKSNIRMLLRKKAANLIKLSSYSKFVKRSLCASYVKNYLV